MVQWQNPVVEARLNKIDMNVTFLLLGLYGYVRLLQTERYVLDLLFSWEYLTSLDVEYAVIRGRQAFRWALVSYRAFSSRFRRITPEEDPFPCWTDVPVHFPSPTVCLR